MRRLTASLAVLLWSCWSIPLPAGASDMCLGRTAERHALDGEVRYYDHPGASVLDGGRHRVARPYGGFHLEAMAAHGGWVASAIDLARFLNAAARSL